MKYGKDLRKLKKTRIGLVKLNFQGQKIDCYGTGLYSFLLLGFSQYMYLKGII